jgi:ABC-type dipeptide/oligopeptide/nickel transport system permease component
MNKINKKGQMNLLSFVAGIVVFVLIWGIWLGKFIAEWCKQAIIDNGYTGLSAFGLAYMNLWIFFMLLIVIAFVYYMSGGSQ